MKRHLALIIACAFLSTTGANAAEVLLGTITATTADKNNSTTAVPFTIATASSVVQIVIQCDTAAYVEWGGATTVATGTTTGLLVPAATPWPTTSTPSLIYLSVEAVAGTSVCKVWRVD